jgi:hypothetical protein
MDKFQEMRVFSAVVEASSFVAAAEKLGDVESRSFAICF